MKRRGKENKAVFGIFGCRPDLPKLYFPSASIPIFEVPRPGRILVYPRLIGLGK